MKIFTLTIAVLFSFIGCYAQTTKFAKTNGHYKTLQDYSSDADPSRGWMDTIKYPPSEFGSSIVYLLVKPHYLSESQVKKLSESVTFPANSSIQVRKELDYLLDLQTSRNEEQIKRVMFLGNIVYWPSINQIPSHPLFEQNLKDLFFEGREVLGSNVTSQNFPKISKLLQGVMQDMRVMEFTVKYRHFRVRPYHLEPKLQPLTKINSPSFASGHTLWAFLQAYIWSELVPEKQNQFMALAEELRQSREIMGVHFPSDNEASRQIAFKMIQQYFQSKDFTNDLKEATEEWKSVSGKFVN